MGIQINFILGAASKPTEKTSMDVNMPHAGLDWIYMYIKLH
jgi:hypothetical protein